MYEYINVYKYFSINIHIYIYMYIYKKIHICTCTVACLLGLIFYLLETLKLTDVVEGFYIVFIPFFPCLLWALYKYAAPQVIIYKCSLYTYIYIYIYMHYILYYINICIYIKMNK